MGAVARELPVTWHQKASRRAGEQASALTVPRFGTLLPADHCRSRNANLLRNRCKRIALARQHCAYLEPVDRPLCGRFPLHIHRQTRARGRVPATVSIALLSTAATRFELTDVTSSTSLLPPSSPLCYISAPVPVLSRLMTPGTECSGERTRFGWGRSGFPGRRKFKSSILPSLTKRGMFFGKGIRGFRLFGNECHHS